MRLDLIINTMFKNGVRNREITVNNPSIWRPIISIEDATNAYIRAIEASESISGIFNVASGNYTVGEVGDQVKMAIEEHLGIDVHLTIHHKRDFRNYKVNVEKAKNVLSFHPNHDVKAIVKNLVAHMSSFQDWDNPQYYNIETLKLLSAKNGLHNLAGVV
jgi:nucleoside-diphosphate-sugar epimerase